MSLVLSAPNTDLRRSIRRYIFPNSEEVLVDGQTVCFFKQWGAGEKRSARRELESYKRIGNILDVEVRTPRLCGVVQAGEDSCCIGLLLSWIDCQYTTLECALRPDTPMGLRRKWADQLTAALERLHRNGVIWGDAKPANILVDRNDDIWMIDFGGGYTRGWVEREIAGTVEGDKQGLQKIRAFLSEQDKEAN
jgi:serine/threonine protein kinase